MPFSGYIIEGDALDPREEDVQVGEARVIGHGVTYYVRCRIREAAASNRTLRSISGEDRYWRGWISGSPSAVNPASTGRRSFLPSPIGVPDNAISVSMTVRCATVGFTERSHAAKVSRVSASKRV